MKTTADEWEAAWSAYIDLLEKSDRARERGAGLRKPRKALARAQARLERLSPGFLARIGDGR